MTARRLAGLSFLPGKFQTRRSGGNPIVVLLDNKMPKVSGLEVLKIMKADEGLKSIPVVVLTSSRETPDLVEFYQNGVNAYVVKPVSFEEFMKAVKQLGVFWGTINEPPPQYRAGAGVEYLFKSYTPAAPGRKIHEMKDQPVALRAATPRMTTCGVCLQSSGGVNTPIAPAMALLANVL